MIIIKVIYVYFFLMSKIIFLHPEEVNFTQEFISERFENGEKITSFIRIFLNNKCVFGEREPETIKITEYNGAYYTLNNRILYWLRHGNYDKIQCILVPFSKCQREFENKFTTRNGGRQTRLKEEKPISNIDIGNICMQSLPCKHDSTITYLDGTVRSTMTSGNNLLRFFIDNNLDIDGHLLDYMSFQRKLFYEKKILPQGNFRRAFSNSSENKESSSTEVIEVDDSYIGSIKFKLLCISLASVFIIILSYLKY
jgi:hypothetical protein